MPTGIGIRAHNYSARDDIQLLTNMLISQHVPYLQFSPAFSFPELTHNGDLINVGMGDYMRKVFAMSGINIAVLSCYVNIIHPNWTVREKLLSRFEKYLMCARSFGANIIATETGSIDNQFIYTKENFTDQAFSTTITSLKRLVQCAEKLGVIIGIEPGVHHPIYSLERTCKMLEMIPSPNLHVLLDPGNLVMAENYKDEISIMEKCFQIFGNKIVAVHLKDFIVSDNKMQLTSMGKGCAPIKDMLSIIKRYMPWGYIFLDEVPNGTKESVNESFQYLVQAQANLK
ncbi:MAG: sugar phosphate isomerase/epimerase family protein [Sporolactobacillus sp.]